MTEKEPLLVVYNKGEAQLHIADFDTSALHETAEECRRIAIEARLRRRRVAGRVHFFGLLLLLTVVYWTRGFGIPSFFASIFHKGHGNNDIVVGLGSTPLDGPLVLPDGLQCRVYSQGKTHAYPVSSHPLVFDSAHSLTVLQNTTRRLAPPYDPPRDDDSDMRWRHVHVSGEVVVRQVVDGKEPSVEVEALSNDKRIRAVYVFAKTGQGLTVIVDDRIWVEKKEWHGGQNACIVVRVTVWVPTNTDKKNEVHLKSIRVGATHLGVQLIDDLDLVVDESARLTSVVGSIVASRALPSKEESAAVSVLAKRKNCHDAMKEAAIAFAPGFRFEAPQTDVITISSPIRGPWSLLDRLHIFSVSGSVSVAVRAEGTADEHKDLADLRIETVSGNIGFEEVKKEATEEDSSSSVVRPHRLALSTRSGTVHGAGSFAQLAKLHTTSGNIAVALAPHKLPENGDAESAVLDTNTVSGKTVVYLLNETTSNLPVDFLESTHHAVSGAVTLHYPASWVGNIHLKTVAGGALVVEGKGVHVVPDDSPRWPPKVGRKVDAIKESDNEDGGETTGHRSSLNADTISGYVRLSFPS